MKSKTYSIFLFCSCLILLASCSQGNIAYQSPPAKTTPTMIDMTKEESFTEMFPIKEMNTKIRFWPVQEKFKKGECPDLDLENFSSEKIIFPSEYGLRIITYSANQWTDIKNTMQYVPPGNPQVSPKGTDLPGIIGFPLCPNLENFNLPIEIRIVVSGETESANNTESIPVGAFIDIVIEK